MRRDPKPAKSKAARPYVGQKSPKNDGAQVGDPEKRLAEAQAQHAATAEILRLIGSSPADAQPVFDAIARNATILTGSLFCNVFRFDGDRLFPVAYHNFSAEAVAAIQQRYPRKPSRDSVGGSAVLDRTVVHLPDIERHPEFAASLHLHNVLGFRSVLAVPILHEGQPVGAITVARAAPRSFSEAHIQLLQTFAAQAVIAIENVRLFNELQERNRALTEAHARVTETLDQQTATSEILRVISQSPTDVQPVFDAIAQSAVRLCRGRYCVVYRVDGDRLHVAAHRGMSPAGLMEMGRRYPALLGAPYNSVRTVRERAVVHQIDADSDPALTDGQRRVAQIEGFRSQVFVPMLQEDKCVGVICLTRPENERYPESQVALLQTFADQAVIAIENVRLFKELQEKNTALTQAYAQVTETLEQQTATSEILS